MEISLHKLVHIIIFNCDFQTLNAVLSQKNLVSYGWSQIPFNDAKNFDTFLKLNSN